VNTQRNGRRRNASAVSFKFFPPELPMKYVKVNPHTEHYTASFLSASAYFPMYPSVAEKLPILLSQQLNPIDIPGPTFQLRLLKMFKLSSKHPFSTALNMLALYLPQEHKRIAELNASKPLDFKRKSGSGRTSSPLPALLASLSDAASRGDSAREADDSDSSHSLRRVKRPAGRSPRSPSPPPHPVLVLFFDFVAKYLVLHLALFFDAKKMDVFCRFLDDSHHTKLHERTLRELYAAARPSSCQRYPPFSPSNAEGEASHIVTPSD
jgi:hypothetical protein